MANANMHNFDNRVRRINKRKSKQARNGSVLVLADDGLITTRTRRRSARFPWRGVALTFACLFILKGILLAQLGAQTYDDRVTKLEQGTVFEQAGAFVMKADPITKWTADTIGTYLR
jgi:hypothetical protein